MSIRPIRFYHRRAIQAVHDVPTTMSVLDWLRTEAHCTGTKEGCNEGDCGACTVLVGELSETGVRLLSVNACLQFMPMLDGKALLTVEDLCTDGSLHPAQQALVACHGSQCGFCTPGFVMSLAGEYQQHMARGSRPTRAALADALAGNLCRCTGYRPILDAGLQMFELPPAPIDTKAIETALRTLALDAPMQHAAPNPAVVVDGRPRIDHFHAPHTLAELARLRATKPEARLLAGGTDLALWVTKRFRDVGELIYVDRVDELKRISLDHGVLDIGAAVPLEDAWSALAAQVPTLTELWRRFASPPVRHAGTMGGNVANGSPIGDSAPVLMALGARIVLRRGNDDRELALEDFYLGYQTNALQPGEFITRIRVPMPGPDTQVRGWKLSKRFDSDISTLCLAVSLTMAGETVQDVRLAFGGMAAIVRRAPRTESAMTGQPWTAATLQQAQVALAQEFTPLSDLRATATYRLRAAGNLLRRLWLETRATAPLPSQATTVWPQRRPGEETA